MTEIVPVDVLENAAIGIVGTGSLAAVVSLVVASSYRWTTTRAPPAGMSVLTGLSVVAGYLSYTAFVTGAVVATVPLDHQASAGYVLTTFLIAGAVAAAGSRLGDRIARQVSGLPRIDADGEAGTAVRSARLATAVGLPETIEDADGYRSVDPSVRRALAGETVRLPHGLSRTERRDRIERHVEGDYGVGNAAVTIAEDGTVERLVVGDRSSELGSMLPPKTVGMAITADPSPNASLGDPVEIWTTGAQSRLVATGTLRTTSGSVATVVVDVDHVSTLSADERYRLVTRPDEQTDGYEFASTLRTADETVVAMTVDPDGPLAGEFAGWLPGRVLVVDRDDEVLALPADNETLRAGDRLWLLAHPADLSRVDPGPDSDTDGERHARVESDVDVRTHLQSQ
ncbi:hypothetical protein OB955_11615 [Halobacteria archaeon AArc-m2/3/4]|uniref:RCK C-terminal domain-containing protein n=1 Tax=Natronoglomus mannanivorans TaxID=2979990 RepID=A0ABT2QEP2_9EURY|nr:hypothetical protein [Halobacteria archaeon AArc-m2/3/4]